MDCICYRIHDVEEAHRLKQTLALPKIQSRPPCPPKIYQKLYRHLDSILPISTRKTARVTTSNVPASVPSSSPAKPTTSANVTPLKPNSSRRKNTSKKARTNDNDTPDLPHWVMPAIRVLCQRMLLPAAPHHVFAGVASITSSWETALWKELKIPALVVAVLLLVKTRLAGVKTSTDEYEQQKSIALETLKDFGGNATEEEEIGLHDVDEYTRQMGENRWIEMDWFINIPIGAELDVDCSLEDVPGNDPGDDQLEEEQLLSVQRSKARSKDVTDHDYLQPGLGTMVSLLVRYQNSKLTTHQMQNRVDYLSDDRTREYQEWKINILAQIDELEATNKMDV